VANFHSVEEYPIFIIRELNKMDKYVITFLGNFFRIVLVIKSCPGDFIFGNFLIIFNILLGLEYGKNFGEEYRAHLVFVELYSL
jgi:hypothetical protein